MIENVVNSKWVDIPNPILFLSVVLILYISISRPDFLHKWHWQFCARHLPANQKVCPLIHDCQERLSTWPCSGHPMRAEARTVEQSVLWAPSHGRPFYFNSCLAFRFWSWPGAGVHLRGRYFIRSLCRLRLTQGKFSHFNAYPQVILMTDRVIFIQ